MASEGQMGSGDLSNSNTVTFDDVMAALSKSLNETDFKVIRPIIAELNRLSPSTFMDLRRAKNMVAHLDDLLSNDASFVRIVAALAAVTARKAPAVGEFLWDTIDDRIQSKTNGFLKKLRLMIEVSPFIKLQVKPSSRIQHEFAMHLEGQVPEKSSMRPFELSAALEIGSGDFNGANIQLLLSES